MRRRTALFLACLAAVSGAAAQPLAAQPMITWDAKHPLEAGTVIGPLTVTGVGKAEAPAGTAEEAKAIDFKDSRGAHARLVADVAFEDVLASIGAGRIDPDGEEAQVLLTTFTGGAHCCVHIQVLDRIGGAWRKVDVGTFDGEPLETFPTDVDGDGIADIVRWDDRFAYAFGCYACSWMPPRIFNIRKGAALDVSAAPRYRALFEKDYEGAKAACLGHQNPACAALVADGMRLGRADEAWKVALANFDRKADWVLPGCKVEEPPDRSCPADKQYTAAEFQPALARFLAEKGYGSSPR